jgi:hypothetical protein
MERRGTRFGNVRNFVAKQKKKYFLSSSRVFLVFGDRAAQKRSFEAK